MSENSSCVNFCLICDDVRKEASGKDILVGVYSGELAVHALPVTLLISLFIEIAPGKTGVQKLRLRALFDDACVYEATATLNVTDIAPFSFGTPKMQITCAREGELAFQAAFDDDEEWSTIQRRGVVLQPTADATA